MVVLHTRLGKAWSSLTLSHGSFAGHRLEQLIGLSSAKLKRVLSLLLSMTIMLRLLD